MKRLNKWFLLSGLLAIIVVIAGCGEGVREIATTTTMTTTTTTITTTTTTTTTVPGDVNGDGYADVIVGAEGIDAGGDDRGQASLFFGGASMDNLADVTFTGENDGDQLGFSVALPGDVNGDGFADLLVGAFLADGGGEDRGEAYLFYGGPSVDNTPDLTFTGAADFDELGYAVAGAGDVNGDGYNDIIIGAYDAAGGGTDRGEVYIFYGGPSIDNIADVTFTGIEDNDFFGVSVAGAGDVNGDGFDDVLVGAYITDGGGMENSGQAYIYYGGLSMDNVADVTFTGLNDMDQLGYSLSGAGDVNGDGFEDVIVGANRAEGGGSERGEAYLYFGGESMDNVADVTFSGGADDNWLGNSVSGARDVNGDGFDDVIIGARRADVGGENRGQTYIYFGGESMDNVADVTFTGQEDLGELGQSVSSAGDLNGDDYDDVIVGASKFDGGGNNRGLVNIYFGEAAMDNVADVIILGAEDNGFFGESVSGVKP
jgi:hypothetical protein